MFELVPPRGVEESKESREIRGATDEKARQWHEPGADGLPLDPDLAKVIAVWPQLSRATRQAILLEIEDDVPDNSIGD